MLREEWDDYRLKFDHLIDGQELDYLTLKNSDIWVPDLFFQNEKEAYKHDILDQNELLRIYPDGRVLYSVRLSLVVSCIMNLEYFPFDKQACELRMASCKLIVRHLNHHLT